MLIINQERNELINFSNVMNISIVDCEKEGYLISAGFIVGRDDNYRDLGYYNTEERAREILQEIYTSYANMEMLKLYNIQIGQVVTSEEMFKAICYQMPEE